MPINEEDESVDNSWGARGDIPEDDWDYALKPRMTETDETAVASIAGLFTDSMVATTKIVPGGEKSAMSLPSPGHGKKRFTSPNEDEQQESFPSDLNDDGIVGKFLSPRAKKIKVMLEESIQTLVYKGPKFPTTLRPTSTVSVQEKPSLDLPLDSLTARLHARTVHTGLEEVQRLLREKPLNGARIVQAIQESTSVWATQYKGSVPDGVKRLISLFENLAMHLQGKATPTGLGDEIISLADNVARPFLQRLDAACLTAVNEVKHLDDEMPGLKEEISKMETLQQKQEQEAEKYERMAADAREKAKEFRSQERNAATKLQSLKIASNTFHMQTDQLMRRRDETFLTLYNQQRKRDGAEAAPEVAIILAYSCDSSEQGL